MTVGIPTIIHLAKLISCPKCCSNCPFSIMSGGVPISVDTPYPHIYNRIEIEAVKIKRPHQLRYG